MAAIQTAIIEVDAVAAEIIRRAEARAISRGETLGSYLQHALPVEVATEKKSCSQSDAWNSFVAGMTAWSRANLPPGYVADDSRDSAYDDRN